MDLPDQAGLLAQPTRARLFSTLQGLRRAATTEELAGELDQHVNGVRRQLERMHEAGLLERRRAAHGRGRPRDEWSIAAAASPTGERPEAYADLARWLARSISPGPARLREVEASGREIGRELAPEAAGEPAESFAQIFTALGFRPAVTVEGEGHLSCTLCNCPYRDSVRENPDLICTLHKGITLGVLDELDPSGRLVRFEPKDPDCAGCLVEVVDAERVGSLATDR
jgi:predicted ArsR family transcriptional regulator